MSDGDQAHLAAIAGDTVAVVALFAGVGDAVSTAGSRTVRPAFGVRRIGVGGTEITLLAGFDLTVTTAFGIGGVRGATRHRRLAQLDFAESERTDTKRDTITVRRTDAFADGKSTSPVDTRVGTRTSKAVVARLALMDGHPLALVHALAANTEVARIRFRRAITRTAAAARTGGTNLAGVAENAVIACLPFVRRLRETKVIQFVAAAVIALISERGAVARRAGTGT
jgi:hypothetical protein